MVSTSTPTLTSLISAAAALSGSETNVTQSPDIATVLRTRLGRAYKILGKKGSNITEGDDLTILQYVTAQESLQLLEDVQSLLDPINSDSQAPPLLGTRDISHMRTLLSIAFNWAVKPLITELEISRHGPRLATTGEPSIIDLTRRQLDFEDLPSITLRILALVFGTGISGMIRQTWVTTSILSHHAVDMLMPCLILGWSPNPFSETFARASKNIKALSTRFINVLRSHQAISALGSILSATTTRQSPFVYVPKACAYLLSNQLKRPDGVRGLCTAVFGDEEEDVEVAPLEKLEHIAKVLRTVPATSKPEAYYQYMVPRILDLLVPSSEQIPSAHKRAAAYTLSQMITPTFQHYAIVSADLLPRVHTPFLSLDDNSKDGRSESKHVPHMSPADALRTLQTFLLHTDPSPTELSTLLTPIAPELYTLASFHRASKIADPNARESLNALLNTWGRIVNSSDAIDGLWSIISGSGGDWESGPDGFARSSLPTRGPSISLLAAAEIQSKEDVDIHANLFNLRPDPSEFVAFLKSLGRQGVSSELFIRLLNEYRALKESEVDPMRTLLCLQLILHMQSELSETILSKPDHILSFIRHALGSEPTSSPALKSIQKSGLGLKDLRIVDVEKSDEGDSDDEDEDNVDGLAESGGGKDEMVVTAITLLLSVLEGNSDLSPYNAPDLHNILVSLEHLTSHTSPAIRQLAREARLVLTARTASTSSNPSKSAPGSTPEVESAQATYQKALKLLQDPIIPVRSHGLQILRELVARPAVTSTQVGLQKPLLDPALVPGILSIFLQSIQDDESYVFLNAVQGLAAMVDGYGREVLRGIVDVYLRGAGIGGSGASVGATLMSQEELDARVRVGEALGAVVRRCGDALGLYVDILVPPLLTILRSSHLPTTLRASALSILAKCVAVNALALNAYTAGLADTCVELVQLESVAAKSPQGNPKDSEPSSTSTGENQNDGEAARPAELTDTDPTTRNAKVAPFRRSALHFLSQLLSSHISRIYDSRTSSASVPSVTLSVQGSMLQAEQWRELAIPEPLVGRMSLILGYVAATDEDTVTRVMAREASELAEQYREACLGL